MRVSLLKTLPYVLPLTRTLKTARGHFNHRHGFIVELEDESQRRGFGDAAPVIGFGGGPTQVFADVARLQQEGLRQTHFESVAAIESFVADSPFGTELRFALSSALLDLWAQKQALVLGQLLFHQTRLLVRSHRLELEGGKSLAGDVVKLKVTRDPLGRSADLARLLNVNAQRIRLDFAGCLSFEQAKALAQRLQGGRVELLEQPLSGRDWKQWAALRKITRDCGLRLAVDESLTSAEDLEALIEAEAADVVVVKPMFVGGLLPALRLGQRARTAGLEVIITHALESAIGRAAAVHLASGFPGVHGLRSVLGRDLSDDLKERTEGVVVPQRPGLGVAPAPTLDGSRATGIPNPLKSAALARPKLAALCVGGQHHSFEELSERAALDAKGLAASGFSCKDKLLVEGHNAPSWIRSLLAVSWFGAAAVLCPQGAKDQDLESIARESGGYRIIKSQPSKSALDERFWPLLDNRLILRSSGSSGPPKWIELSTLQLLLSAFGSTIRLGHSTSDCWLCCMPLHHIGGVSILFRALFNNTKVIVHDSFDADHVLSTLLSEPVTLISVVPAMLQKLLSAANKRDLNRIGTKLRAVLVGGQHAPRELLEVARAAGLPVTPTWGMTETASQLATAHPGTLSKSDTVGPPLAFARLWQSDEGRLGVEGPMTPGGHLLTNDLGKISDSRALVTGRIDSVIISGGEKIDLRTIEKVLESHPEVRSAVVLGRPSARWGQRPIAWLETDFPLSEELLSAWCRQKLPSLWIPDRFVVVDRLQRSDAGKVLRCNLPKVPPC